MWLVEGISNHSNIATPLPRVHPEDLLPLSPIQLYQLETKLRGYIGKGVQTRIDAGLSYYLAELRRISVVFVNLSGLSTTAATKGDEKGSLDEEKSYEDKLNIVLQSMQRIIFRHEGYIRQFLVDVSNPHNILFDSVKKLYLLIPSSDFSSVCLSLLISRTKDALS